MAIELFLLFLILVPGLLAQLSVRSAIKKYSRVPVQSGRTGAQAAAELMNDAGIHDVEITRTTGFLGDHYDPRTKTLALSPDVYDGRSIAALGIAAHETGHAIQHQHLYAPLQVRSAIVPVTMFASRLVWPIVLIGFLLRSPMLIFVGIVGYAIMMVFQLITLPVEFNASSRAKLILQTSGLINRDEIPGVNRVLNAAALTYVAAAVATAAQLARLILMNRGRR